MWGKTLDPAQLKGQGMLGIYKYRLRDLGINVISSYKSFRPLRVAYQDEQLYLWSLVNTDTEPTTHRIFVTGTGQLEAEAIYEGTSSFAVVDGEKCYLEYVDTVFNDNYRFHDIWHVFYLLPVAGS